MGATNRGDEGYFRHERESTPGKTVEIPISFNKIGYVLLQFDLSRTKAKSIAKK